jgi:hypothetical protein
MSSRRGSVSLTCEAALVLADLFFGVDTPDGRQVQINHGQFFASGQLSAWSSFAEMELPPEDMSRIGRFLLHRPLSLANATVFIETVHAHLSDGRVATYQLLEPGVVTPTHSGETRLLLDELLDQLDSVHASRQPPRATATQGAFELSMTMRDSDGRRYRVARTQFELNIDPEPAELPVLITREPVPGTRVDLTSLVPIAAALDAAKGSTHLSDVLAQIIERLTDSATGSDVDVLDVRSGHLRLLNAPTGAGKSVLMRLVAVDAVRLAQPITLVVPDVAATLELARTIQEDLIALGLPGSVVPLVSPRRAHHQVVSALARPPSWDPNGEWTRRELGYGCALAGATNESTPIDVDPGDEPCRSLIGNDGRRHDCPFLKTCDKHRLARTAVTASVVITNHANFQVGRMPIPVRVRDNKREQHRDRLSIAELVLRRSELVVIDEIDKFQQRAVSDGGRALTLADRRGRDTALLTLDRQRRECVAAGNVDPALEGRFQAALSRVTFLSERYLTAVTLGQLGPGRPSRPGARRRDRPLSARLHLPRRWDNLLACRLAGEPEADSPSDEAVRLLGACFPSEDIAEPLQSPPGDLAIVATALDEAISQDRGDDRVAVARARADEALTARLPDAVIRAETVDLLVHRAFREQLRAQLQRLVNLLPFMRDAGMFGVDDIEDVLGRWRTWQAAPWGPLGRIVFAFGLHVDPDEPGNAELTVEIVAGDPQGYVADVGLTTATALTGSPRPVLGLSATAYFPGAADAHVHAPVAWHIPDRVGGEVSVEPATVVGRDGAPVKISGTPRDERLDRLETLGEGLWPQYLAPHLRALAEGPETRDRARVLCVVNAYEHAIALARGMLKALPPAQAGLLAVAAPPRQVNAVRAALPAAVTVLAGDDLARFPETGAVVLIAPYGRVNRGLNILVRNQSAIGSIWACIRPLPLVDTPAQLLAHVGARARKGATAAPDPLGELARRQRVASTHLEHLIHTPRTFTTLPSDVQEDVIAGMLVELIQLVGRARRGGTSTTLHLVDNAFHTDGVAPGVDLATLLDRLRSRWLANGDWPLLEELQSISFAGLYGFADAVALAMNGR